MDLNLREILATMSKETLIDLIIQNAENDYYAIELFLLKSEYAFSEEQLRAMWHYAYNAALMLDKEDDNQGANMLTDCAEMYFEHIKRQKREQLQLEMARDLVNDLIRACTEDGIGMRGDSEWLYMDVAKKIVTYYDEKGYKQLINSEILQN